MSLQSLSLVFTSKILPLVFSIIGFGLLVVVHEFGHFLFCKLFNIYTPTFSVGFGKPLIEKKIGTTNFRISRLPFGGYVEIAGLQEVGQGDQQFAKASGSISFAEKPFWQKFLHLWKNNQEIYQTQFRRKNQISKCKMTANPFRPPSRRQNRLGTNQNLKIFCTLYYNFDF